MIVCQYLKKVIYKMTIEFKEEQILKREQCRREPYIGYFAPDGKLIDYNILLGGEGHDDWINPVS